ncbi:MAG TPA: hypothetical protein PKW23_04590 [Dictyoglomaceae bacterium]|nr:hypothetical protein [Dictyoglomaceae bacterium]HPU44422.1 hypothetical protein [Dictyoglomaceae bacterium]
MNTNDCPICKKIREEKEKYYKNLKTEIYLCKNHMEEAIKVKPDIDIFKRENVTHKEICPVCELEKGLIEHFSGNYQDLCFFHLNFFRDKLTPKDWDTLIEKWEEIYKYLKEVIASYDYRSRISLDKSNITLILDLILGSGRRY